METAKFLLEVLRKEKKSKYKNGIYHYMQVNCAYNSNHMEGSMLTQDQTRYIFDEGKLPVESGTVKVSDIIETINHFRCFDYMLDMADAPLTPEIVKEFHRLLKVGTPDADLPWFAVGGWKKKPNYVGKMRTMKRYIHG